MCFGVLTVGDTSSWAFELRSVEAQVRYVALERHGAKSNDTQGFL